MKLRQDPIPAHMRSPRKQEAALITTSAPSPPSMTSLSDAEWTREARALIKELEHFLTPTDGFELYVKRKILFVSENGSIALYARNGYGAPHKFEPLANGSAGLVMLDNLAQRGPGHKMDWNWTEFEFQEVSPTMSARHKPQGTNPPKNNPPEDDPPKTTTPKATRSKTNAPKSKAIGSTITFVRPKPACRVTRRKQPIRKKPQT